MKRWPAGLWMLAVPVLLAGCSSLPQRAGSIPDQTAVISNAPSPSDPNQTPDTRQPPDPTRTQAVFTAIQMVGVPYEWGGATPKGFDCSGLVQFAYARAGRPLPRTAEAQMNAVMPLTLEKAQAGDLLFFRQGNRTSHVAIYLGDGRFVHAPSSGHEVSIDSFDNSYWRTHFARAGRVPAS